MLTKLIRILLFVNALNIDVVLGGVGGYLLAAKTLGVRTDLSEIMLLSLALWCVYVIDRLLDVRKENVPDSLRHGMYKKYFGLFAGLMFLLLPPGAYFSFVLLSAEVLTVYGWVLAGACLLHLLLAGGFVSVPAGYPKEPVVALLYTAGIWGCPLLRLSDYAGVWPLALLSFFMLALANLFLLAQNDFTEEHKNQHNPPPRHPFVEWLPLLFSVMGALLAFLYATVHAVGWVLFFMHLLMLLPIIFRERFKFMQLYRIVADTVFLLSFLVLFMQ